MERQRLDCEALAQRLGWTVAEVYTDNDISAFSGKTRPEYQRMTADIAGDQRDGLIFYQNARLHRSPRELEDFVDLIQKTGIPVQSVTSGSYDLSTASGRMIARQLGVAARYESELLSERVRRKHQELRESGAFPGGRRSFGYTDGRTGIVEAEAELVRAAAAELLTGVTLRQIVRRWNDAGYVTTQGNIWRLNTFKYLFTANYSRGLTTDGRKAQWPAIIDEVTARRLDALLLDPARTTRRTGTWRHLLTGVLYCGACGALMKSRRGNHARGYACNNQALQEHTSEKGCWLRIKAEPIEQDVTGRLLARLDASAVGEGYLGAAQNKTARVAQLDELDARSDEIADMLADGDLDRAGYRRAKDRLDRLRAEVLAATRRDDVAERRRATQAEAFDLAGSWRSLDIDRQRIVLDAFVERIEVRPATVKGRPFYDPGRVVVTWRE